MKTADAPLPLSQNAQPSGLIFWARRILDTVAATLLTLALLTASFYTEENWRGHRAWEKCRRELEARGERLDWAAYLPKQVPDAQNFFKTPLLEAVAYRGRIDENVWWPIEQAGEGLVHDAWGDAQRGRTLNWPKCQAVLRSRAGVTLSPLPQAPAADLLESLHEIEPQLEELRQASLQPLAQLDFDRTTPFASSADVDLVSVRLLSQVFGFHACAELELGHGEIAVADLRVIHRLSAGLRNENELVKLMICAALQGLAVQSFWEGWAKGRWSERELAEVQELFGQIDLLPEFRRVLCAERAGIDALVEQHVRQKNGLFELWRRIGEAEDGAREWSRHVPEPWLKLAWRLVPRGWVSLNLAVYNRQMQDLLPPSLALRPSRISPPEMEQLKQRFEQKHSLAGLDGWLAGVAIPRFAKALEAAARVQNFLNQAIVVCALERHRKTHGQYPEFLSELTLQCKATLPGDVITGRPLLYRRNSDGTFRLYSVGWNEMDDHGAVAMSGDEPPRPDCTEGDWVWQYPME
jgi:hypothetical protein